MSSFLHRRRAVIMRQEQEARDNENEGILLGGGSVGSGGADPQQDYQTSIEPNGQPNGSVSDEGQNSEGPVQEGQPGSEAGGSEGRQEGTA